MAIEAFEHVNIRSTDVERAREFYVAALGLRVGDRPPFASVGYWLYLGDNPVVHLVQRASGEPGTAGSGNVDHLAFRGVDLDGTRQTLRAAGVEFREAVVPRDNTIQVFLYDPDGLKLELTFRCSVAESPSPTVP
jgi:catechol 2,3-dioxygenase-like lactoylglutathione lyase family enzyme